MKKNYSKTILFSNLVIFLAGFEWFVLRPSKYAALISLGYVLIFFIESFILSKIGGMKERWWVLSVFPIELTIAAFLASTLPDDAQWVQIIVLLSTWFIGGFWHKASLLFLEPRLYRQGSLEYLADYGNLFIVLLLSASLYGYGAFIETPTWVSMPLFAVALFFIYFHFFWFHKLEAKVFFKHTLIGTLVITELAWAIMQLPFDYFNLALLLTISFYTVTHLQKLYLQAKLTSEKLRHYLIFIALSYILIFLSARWL